MKDVLLLAGARPNFMKIAPLRRALDARGFSVCLVHTGQHYDECMSDVFFRELEISKPDIHLGVGAGDRIAQTRKIKSSLVPVLHERAPEALVVVGDVTSTAAGAMAGVMAGTPVVHVEAGLRSFNWRMPEELNRMIADHHSDLLFVSDPAGLNHLKDEAIPDERIHFVGNVMIDTLHRMMPTIDRSAALSSFGIAPKTYGLVTLHRPETVDHRDLFGIVLRTLGEIAGDLPLVWPMHPRAKRSIEAMGLAVPNGIRVIDPLGYVDMIAFTKHARLVLTDSGGVQEETTVLGIPCITLRDQTERPVTVTVGTSEIVGRDAERILDAARRAMRGEWKQGGIPEFWDGRTAERIADILARS